MRKYRQGDILIIEETKVPNNLKKKEDNVVAYGETTGHSHRIENGNVLVNDMPNDMFIEAGKQTKLVHDEHDEIKIPEGFYRVIRQREFDGENIRTVID